MSEINYINENTFLGELGHAAVLFAFVTAIIAAVFYYLNQKNEENNYLKLARISFISHAISVFLVIGLLAYAIITHSYEYSYPWKYSSDAMSLKYIFSCFWAGQEGSFLTWIFWQVIVGLILMFTAKKWESKVMTVFAVLQAFLITMIFGIYIGDLYIGASPFVLIRELPEYIGLPWTQMPDYLSSIPQFQDGQGLNPLLQNYWMTIHPPTTFLGFALTSVPFAFAIAGLWKKDFYGWLRPSLPWAFIGVMVLGIAILMGGAWAYESLSFGGFWAWDPVENAIFIPWLCFVAAAHLLLIAYKRKRALFSAIIFSLLTFILIVYSTFLTRSGVLGDTSVHSFSGEGMLGQLLFFLLSTIFISVLFLLKNKKQKLYLVIATLVITLIYITTESLPLTSYASLTTLIGFSLLGYYTNIPRSKEEEELWSKEFWMFLGAIVFVLASLHLLIDTSSPVFNKIFGTNRAPFTELDERFEHYNPWHAFYAILYTLFMAISQFLKYKKTDKKHLWKLIKTPIIISIIITALLGFSFKYNSTELLYLGLLFTSILAILVNIKYIKDIINKKTHKSGSAIAHIGIGLILVGIIISTSKSVQISQNTSGTNIKSVSTDFDNNTNIQVFKNDTLRMGNYFINYSNKKLQGVNLYFDINYFKAEPIEYEKGDIVYFKGIKYKANKTHKPTYFFDYDLDKWDVVKNNALDVVSSDAPEWKSAKVGKYLFTLNPFIQMNEKFGYVIEPGTKHYWNYDVFTFLKYFDKSDVVDGEVISDDYMHPIELDIKIYDTIVYSKNIIISNGIKMVSDSLERIENGITENDLAFKLQLNIIDENKKSHLVEPFLIYKDSITYQPKFAYIDELKIKMRLKKLDQNQLDGTFKLDYQGPEYIVMEAKTFPFINILWIGSLVMAIGTVIAVWDRIKTKK